MIKQSSQFLFFLLVWLLLSGHYTPLLISLGIVSSAIAAYFSNKLGIFDMEGHPTHLFIRIFPYWTWLFYKIIQANIDVCKAILKLKLDLKPEVITLPCSQKTDMGRVIYANSITLTPGTLTLRVNKSQIQVHSLTHEGAEELKEGEMDRRVSQIVEGL